MPGFNQRHVLIACHAWYGDTIGGSFRLASEFAGHLAALGHRVSYLCCAPDEHAVPMQTIDGVNVYRYPLPSANGRFAKLRHHVRHASELSRTIHQQNSVDVVSSHSPLQGLGAARSLSARCVFINYTVHSPFDDELLSDRSGQSASLRQRFAARVARWVDYRNVTLADVIQTDSQYTQDNFRRKHGSGMLTKGIIAPGWVETDLFRPTDDLQALRATLGDHWNTKAPLFFTLRRLERRMGLDTLIEACDRLNEEGLKFRTLIGGGGSLRDPLQTMIEDRGLQQSVKLIGRLPEDQLAGSYAAADCFVLPTRALECFGLIVLEAFSCNTPVIASAAAAIPELAERQGDEWMFEPGNVEQLTERLRSFLTGKLSPTVNLRDIAMEYNKPKILSRWTELLQPATVQKTSSHF